MQQQMVERELRRCDAAMLRARGSAFYHRLRAAAPYAPSSREALRNRSA